ncbi:MAG: ATP-dependent 6-phosphofructokinase [Kiritimatiellaeota bacterium]|nr:ATP-dependent 6-phosphofructokinase [Kiritimatiellota bacterium]
MAVIQIGVLTSGGDCPGLNAAIRGLGKALISKTNGRLIGFKDGFRGIAQDVFLELSSGELSGILTRGGTILGTARDKPHRMMIDGEQKDMTDVIVSNYKKRHLDALVCLGGGGTQKNALRLANAGLNVLTLPKTIDNDVWGTDVTFGFDTALCIATDAIDRLHSTATSHHRIIVVEIMGHRAGWLALGAGIAGGADVVVIPEIPYDIEKMAAAIRGRTEQGKRFSIVAVAEGALSLENKKTIDAMLAKKAKAKSKEQKKKISKQLEKFHERHIDNTLNLTKKLEELTGLESRLTILGHLQRGGIPSAGDRLLASRLGTACAEAIRNGVGNAMIGLRDNKTVTIPLEKVAGKLKLVPPDHQWVKSARDLSISFGD